MLFKLILLFTLLPIAELVILIRLAQITSLWSAIGLVIFTGVLGAYLAKGQGRLILTKIKFELNEGRMPGEELINGLCVLIGGALLLTPGIITDIIGFALVIPGTRDIFKHYIKLKLQDKIQKGNIYIYHDEGW